jgi:hypothetical protein
MKLSHYATIVAVVAGLVAGNLPQVTLGGVSPRSSPVKAPNFFTASASAQPESYTGPCPAAVGFAGTITGASGSQVSYAFRFVEPGAKSATTQKTSSATIGSSGKIDVKSSGVVAKTGSGWVELLVPNNGFTAKRSSFHARCTAQLPPISKQPSYIGPPTNLQVATDMKTCESHGYSAGSCKEFMARGAVMVLDWKPACKNCEQLVTGYMLYRVNGKKYTPATFTIGGTKQTALALTGSPQSLNKTCYVATAYKGKVVSKYSGSECIRVAFTNPTLSPLWSSSLNNAKAFDEVWDVTHMDGNQLPLDPFWAAQLEQPSSIPSFQGQCGSDFNGLYLPAVMAKCSDQVSMLTYNLYPTDITSDFGHCSFDPISGHINWTMATYTGSVYYQDWSKRWPWDDDDININLQPDNNAGLTADNNGYIGLEFDKGETLDNYSFGPWAVIDRDVQCSLLISSCQSALVNQFSGRPAVATGVLGIDGVHGGYTEVHPVLAFAFLFTSGTSGDGEDETWLFFVRNVGNEGDCSYANMSWGTGGNYFINIPWPSDATNAKVTSLQLQASDTAQFWGYTNTRKPQKCASLMNCEGLTSIGFELSAPQYKQFYDGQVTIHFDSAKKRTSKQREAGRTGHVEENAGWSSFIAGVKNAQDRAKLTAFFKANYPAASQTRTSDKYKLSLGSNQLAARSAPSLTDAESAHSRQAQVVADPARATAIADFQKKLKAFLPPIHLKPK